MRSLTFRVLVTVAAIAAFATSVFTSQFSFVVLAMVAVLLLATSFSQASRLTEPLARFRQQAVHVRVWGAALPGSNGAAMTLASVKALGAGLHLYLQVGAGGPATHLKIAQPSRAQLQPETVVIESARYVQWSGKRLPRITGAPAVTISLTPVAFHRTTGERGLARGFPADYADGAFAAWI
jgi:hypothetical protein